MCRGRERSDRIYDDRTRRRVRRPRHPEQESTDRPLSESRFVFLGAEQWFAEQPALLQRRQPVLGRDPLVEVMLKLGRARDLVDESDHSSGSWHGGNLSGASYEGHVTGLQRDGELADHGIERPHEFLAEFVVDFEASVELSAMDLAPTVLLKAIHAFVMSASCAKPRRPTIRSICFL